jgi:PAS domain S-box-containing protein
MKMKEKRKKHLSKDLAEKKKSEEALRASEEKLRLITNQVPAILWSTDTELRFTSSTGAGLDALGLKKDQVVGVTLFEYLQTDNPEHLVIKAYRKAIKGNTASYEFEWDGRFFDCHVSPLKNSEGSIIGSIGYGNSTAGKQTKV